MALPMAQVLEPSVTTSDGATKRKDVKATYITAREKAPRSTLKEVVRLLNRKNGMSIRKKPTATVNILAYDLTRASRW